MRRIGPFEAVGELGRGAMGVVYRARDPATGREVALKLVGGRASPTALERLRREGELTARLSHSGIVAVHSAGDHEGRPWIAYEMVQGARTLDEAFAEEGRELRLQQVVAVARALGHAHAQGVVHRDVKPDNVLVLPDGSVKVADFGIASAADLERLTRTGAMVGTPSYMAPEQLQGGQVSPATDVWALGVLLYEALTDKLPVSDAGSMVELMHKILHESPPKPSTLEGEISSHVERVCLKALSKASADRYADATEMADALEAALEAPVGGQRGTLLALGSVAIAVLLALAVTVALKASSPRPVAAPPVEEPEQQTEEVSAKRTAPEPLSAEQERTGRKRLRALAHAREGQERVAGFDQWLADYPGHSQAREAAELRERALWQLEPAQVVAHAPPGDVSRFVVARFVGERLLSLSHQDEEHRLRVWGAEGGGLTSVADEPGERWLRDAAPFPGDPRSALVLTSPGGLRKFALDDGTLVPFPAGEPFGAVSPPLSKRFRGTLAVAGRSEASWVAVVNGEGKASPPLEVLVVEGGAARSVALDPAWPEARVVRHVALDRAGQTLAVAGHGSAGTVSRVGGLLRVYELPSGRLLGAQQQLERVEDLPPLGSSGTEPPAATRVAVSPDGRWVAASLAHAQVVLGPRQGPFSRLRSGATLRSGTVTNKVSVPGDSGPLAFSPSGDRLYVLCRVRVGSPSEDQLNVWATEDRRWLGSATLPFSPWSVDLAADGTFLAMGGRKGELAILRVR